MKQIKVVFLCGHKSRYGLAHLEPILESKFNVAAVVIADDKRWKEFGEKLNGEIYVNAETGIAHIIRRLAKKIILRATNLIGNNHNDPLSYLRKLTNHKKVKVITTDDVNDPHFIEQLRELKVDLLLSAAYPQIFSSKLIELPPLGAVNFHPSLLPKFRGAHPHFWVIAKGENYSGLTAHFMTEKIDKGEIVAQLKFLIENFNYSELYDKIVEETPNVVKLVQEFFFSDNPIPLKQSDNEVSYYRNDRIIHHRVFWNIHTAEEIVNLIRTQKAFCFFRGKKIQLLEAYVAKSNRNLTNNISVESGTILDFFQDGVVIKANNGCIYLQKVKTKNRIISYRKWIIKERVCIGEKLD